MKVVVTGGSGFLGRNLKKYRPEWVYLSSRECNLLLLDQCDMILRKYNPDAIVHLAGMVGGIKDNLENQAEYYYKNTIINTNLIHSAHKNGVKRVLASLSTCAFPDVLPLYPFKEEDMYNGLPAISNLSYGYTKRSLHMQVLSYRTQYGLNYSTFCPSNIYGPGDHFSSEKSHFIAALVTKVSMAANEDTIKLWGTGEPLRQYLYVDDLCDIIPKMLENHNTDIPIIVAPKDNLSIKEMAEKMVGISGKKLRIEFNGKLDGQYRKDGSNKKLLNLIGDYKFTTIEEGLKKTYEWYKENK
tara:strand:+ start:338 stop:1234 length:897 start_codon:yes stop_codon:yes gene_type:complete